MSRIRERYRVATHEGCTGYNLADFARWCHARLVLDTGGPFVLERHERRALGDYFAGVVESVVIVPKKNGKTTLLAALALYHLEHVPEAECVIGASSRDQARILFKQAAGLVRRSDLTPSLYDVRSGYGEIRLAGQKDGARIRVLAADVSTADGVIPTLALVDELHRHPSGELYGVFRDGLGPRDGQMVTISTAGADLYSPLGELRRKAHQMQGFVREPQARRSYVRTPDRSFAFHEWSLSPEDDPHDMRIVKKVNPASWHTITSLQRRHDSPSTTPWQWLRFACGVWTEGEEPWMEPAAWDRLAQEWRIRDGEPVWIGLDVGYRGSTSALVVAAGREDGNVLVEARIGYAGAEMLALEDDLRELAARYDVQAFAYDPRVFGRSAEVLELEGLFAIEFPQTAERMGKASARLWDLIERGKLHHTGDPALRAHVLAGIVKESERGWRVAKDPRSRRSVEALIALVMAVQIMDVGGGSVEPLVAWGTG